MSGYNSESDSLTRNIDENAMPPLSKRISLINEDKSSLPSEHIGQPLTKRFKSGPASKVRGPRRGKVKELEKKETEEGNSTEPGNNAEMPRRSGRPKRNSRTKLQFPEEREKSLEKENTFKASEEETSGVILSTETQEKLSEVSGVEKIKKSEHMESLPKAQAVGKRGRTKKEAAVSEKLVDKASEISVGKRNLRGKVDGKSPMVEKKFRAGEEKKPKLGFVIPKKKPPDPNPVLSGIAIQPKANVDRVPSKPSFLRIPKLSAALSTEDKERSVLAKLDTDAGKREALKWNSSSSWTGKTSGTSSGNVAEHPGFGSQDKQPDGKWQRTSVERFRIQNFNGQVLPMLHHPSMLPQQPWQPKVPLLGFAPPGINVVNNDWNRYSNNMNYGWINSCGVGLGPPQNCVPGGFPSQPPSHRMDEQWPIPTIGYNIPVIQSSERLTNDTAESQSVQQNCEGERGPPSLSDPAASLERSEPVLRQVPYVNRDQDDVYSSFDDDDDVSDDRLRSTGRLTNGRPCEVVDSSSADAGGAQSFSQLEERIAADNMDDSIRLFAEAVQEAIEQGDVSPEKCDRLVNLYEKLCQDLITEDVIENQQNAEAAGINCDTINQTVVNELRSIEDIARRQRITSSLGAASDLLRSFGSVDKCPSRGGDSIDRNRLNRTDQMSFPRVGEDPARNEKSSGYHASCTNNVAGSYRRESNVKHASGGGSFDNQTNRSFAILQDDDLWRGLLAQAQSPGMSEESLELLRRLLLEAGKRGVYDEQMVNMLNVVCQHIKLEDSKEQSLRKEFESIRTFRDSACDESIEIPFINEEQNFIEGKGMLKKSHKRFDATQISPELSMAMPSGLYGADEMNDSESESRIKRLFRPNKVAEDKFAAEKREQVKRKQEDFATKVLDEIRLLETLIAIQCELAVVACPGVPPIATSELPAEPLSKLAEPVPPIEPGNLPNSSVPRISPTEPSKAFEELSAKCSRPPAQPAASSHPVVEKASSESCDTPNLTCDSLMCHPSTSTAGDESQDSHSTQRSAKSTKETKEKETVTDKKPTDPKAIEEKVISLARNALKPHYHNGAITSDEFKLIMKKAITKICKSRSTDISQKRIAKFMNAYVEKVVQSRK